MTFFHPVYDRKPWFYWLLWIFLIIYTIVLGGVYLGLFVHNSSPLHSWFTKPGLPGDELVSFRGSFTVAMIRVSVFSHLFFLMFGMCLIAFRKTYGCNVVWFALILVCAILALIAWAAFTSSYSHCNGLNEFGNLCNDPRYCCVAEVLAATTFCPNVLPCAAPPVTLGELHPRGDFLGLYWTHTILFLMQGFFVGLVVWSMSLSPEEDEEEKEKEEEEEENVKQVPSAPPKDILSQIKPNGSSKRVHGLRQRK